MAAVDVSYDGSLAIQEKAKLRVSRTFFEVVTLGSLLVMCALGLVFWAIGERNRRAGLVGIAISAGDTGLPDPEN